MNEHLGTIEINKLKERLKRWVIKKCTDLLDLVLIILK
jgi:hypothetical protein